MKVVDGGGRVALRAPSGPQKSRCPRGGEAAAYVARLDPANTCALPPSRGYAASRLLVGSCPVLVRGGRRGYLPVDLGAVDRWESSH